MNFIVLVITLLLERVLGEHARLRDPRWYDAYADWLRKSLDGKSFWSGPVGVLLVVFPPVIVTGLVYAVLGGAFWSLLALLFSIAVLWFCLGPRDLDAEVDDYIEAAEVGDASRIAEAAAALTGSADGKVVDGVLLQFNERYFAVLFWFVLLGPMGAVLYRAAALARHRGAGAEDSGFASAAVRLQGILDWVPARLIALGFALAGSFEEAVTDWKASHERKADEFWVFSNDLIVAVGHGALRLGDADETDAAQGPARVRAALGLVLRTLIVWVVLFGLITIGGFAF